ncbi:cobyrinic acid ac-diamide synthase [Undibacterium sp.]|jgi:chromosome partitioning protein|uniref:nucleotide-binding protein n=1 Tax=Undibacterium sp. TaxID=1914977 RepID=UPI002B9EABFB|nr:cobyrinic acid ac-diamide synthase [Undibacterium sp.]HTD06823.1 cobyrinic acid ac-diamide synthase [Undibacterium sp.]
MIVTIANESGGATKSILADNLAALRTMAGRKVLLLDNDPQHPSVNWSCERQVSGNHPPVAARPITGKGLQPELENLAYRYNDIVIDTESRDSLGSRSALTAAHVVIIPVDLDLLEKMNEEKMLARIGTARQFKPRLRILVVITCSEPLPCGQRIAIVRNFASKIAGAQLFPIVIHSGRALRQAFRDGLSICECRSAGQAAISEMQELCSEVFDGESLMR